MSASTLRSNLGRILTGEIDRLLAQAPGELARTRASRDKWRALAHKLGPALRTALARLENARNAVTALQADKAAMGGRLARAEQDAKRWQVRAEDLEHELRLTRQHEAMCPTAQAIADHVHDKAVSNR